MGCHSLCWCLLMHKLWILIWSDLSIFLSYGFWCHTEEIVMKPLPVFSFEAFICLSPVFKSSYLDSNSSPQRKSFSVCMLISSQCLEFLFLLSMCWNCSHLLRCSPLVWWILIAHPETLFALISSHIVNFYPHCRTFQMRNMVFIFVSIFYVENYFTFYQ